MSQALKNLLKLYTLFVTVLVALCASFVSAARRAVAPGRLALVLFASLSLGACANVKPVIQSVDDIARTLCAKFHQEKVGVNLEDAAKFYCETREAYAPWIDAALASVQVGGVAAASQKAGVAQCAEPAPVAPTAPAPVPVAPVAPEGGG